MGMLRPFLQPQGVLPPGLVRPQAPGMAVPGMAMPGAMPAMTPAAPPGPGAEQPPVAPEVIFTVDPEEERRRAERAKRFAARPASFEIDEQAAASPAAAGGGASSPAAEAAGMATAGVGASGPMAGTAPDSLEDQIADYILEMEQQFLSSLLPGGPGEETVDVEEQPPPPPPPPPPVERSDEGPQTEQKASTGEGVVPPVAAVATMQPAEAANASGEMGVKQDLAVEATREGSDVLPDFDSDSRSGSSEGNVDGEAADATKEGNAATSVKGNHIDDLSLRPGGHAEGGGAAVPEETAAAVDKCSADVGVMHNAMDTSESVTPAGREEMDMAVATEAPCAQSEATAAPQDKPEVPDAGPAPEAGYVAEAAVVAEAADGTEASPAASNCRAAESAADVAEEPYPAPGPPAVREAIAEEAALAPEPPAAREVVTAPAEAAAAPGVAGAPAEGQRPADVQAAAGLPVAAEPPAAAAEPPDAASGPPTDSVPKTEARAQPPAEAPASDGGAAPADKAPAAAEP